MGAGAASSLLVIAATAALASVLVAVAGTRRSPPPVVVLELLLGIVVGPQVLGLAHVGPTTELFSDLGLGMLFFFAGYEIDLRRIRGRPARLAGAGWLLSIALAYAVGGVLEASGLVVSFLYAGSALASTALGLLIPILRDAGELRTPFGTQVLAVGTVGEVGPILLITLVLSTTHPAHEAVLLVAFVLLAVATGLLAVRLGGVGLAARAAGAGDERAAGRADHRRARLRPRRARRGARPRHPPGRARGGAHHPGRAAGTRDRRARVQARPRSATAS